nr:GNAT family N-acetyltransferase [Pontibaca salina]
MRGARPLDAGALGAILWDFQDQTDWMPDLYSEAQTIAFCSMMSDRGLITVAERNSTVIGFLALEREYIHGLYLDRTARGQGVGRLLIDHAKTRAERLELRVAQHNATAKRFYRLAGFKEVARGDGSANDENLPDVHFVWRTEVMA